MGGVGAEVGAAGAAVPERAGVPAGGHVARLGADPEWHRDPADLFAGRVGVRQGGRAGPDPVSAGVDLQRPQPVLGVAGALAVTR